MQTNIIRYSEKAVLISFGPSITLKNHEKVKLSFQYLSKITLPWLIEVIPSYNSILIEYDPFEISFEKLSRWWKQLDFGSLENLAPSQDIQIPVCYDEEWAIDLPRICKSARINSQDFIKIHAGKPYHTFLLGFQPGFPYMGLVDKSIAKDRLENPRAKVLKGSVGIAGRQTGIYPNDSPGGWNLVGRTPLPIFDTQQSPNFLINMGHKVTFIPIDKNEFYELEKNPEAWNINI